MKELINYKALKMNITLQRQNSFFTTPPEPVIPYVRDNKRELKRTKTNRNSPSWGPDSYRDRGQPAPDKKHKIRLPFGNTCPLSPKKTQNMATLWQHLSRQGGDFVPSRTKSSSNH